MIAGGASLPDILAQLCAAIDTQSPDIRELRFIEDAGHSAVIAIEGERSRAALQKAFLELKASEQELRRIVDAIPQTIVVLSPNGTPLYGNRTVLDYTGLTVDEV